MSRRPFVAGNWKMHKTAPEAAAFVTAFGQALPDGVDVAVCPPFTALGAAVEAARGTPVAVYAQNMHQAEAGAFTGEVSAGMLLAAGVDGVLIGHSERRQLFGETDESVNLKVKAVQQHGMTPIVCVGETLEEREAGATADRVSGQTRGAFAGVKAADVATSVIAYEPIWAIGTGRNATPEDANETIGVIRAAVRDLYDDETADVVRIQYGGSVKSGTIAALMAMPEIDGALVGGASLDPDEFARIVQYRR
jgi:triosephosphate isomerase